MACCKIQNIILALMVLLIFSSSIVMAESGVDQIVKEIRELEDQRDPKCYATASRLEDFMFGTPLAYEARFEKNQLQKDWVKTVWQMASHIAKGERFTRVSSSQIELILSRYFNVHREAKGHWRLTFSDGNVIRINELDKKQYSSIAYSLRAVLAVQQESMLDFDADLLPLDDHSLQLLIARLDLLNLAALKLSDRYARTHDQKTVSTASIRNIWRSLTAGIKEAPLVNNIQKSPNKVYKPVDLSLLNKIIEQKIASYKAYNQISNQVFNRNLQVYFAKMNWPRDPKAIKEFRKTFTEAMIQFSYDLYKESEGIALKNAHDVIQEQDVNRLIQSFVPHQVDAFEDSLFFPNLPLSQQVTIESYDADAFRDNSAHWKFLKYAVNSSNLNAKLQPDPYALELMAENIALYGVLSLKMAGIAGRKSGAEFLTKKEYQQGLLQIAKRVKANRELMLNSKINAKIISSSSSKTIVKSTEADELFTDITENIGIDMMHRSADWLSRMLRSFLKKSESVGVIYIPPAFGGGGVAAEDINNDGYTDLLFLSGKGNQLYLNDKGQKFVDISATSGINWRRKSDGQFGEPRQPLIADLNNDGLQDIVITYVGDSHRVYQNIGNARFKDVTHIANLGGRHLVGGPATVADFDNDGLLDIYITYFGNYTKGVLPTLKRKNENGIANQLFKNMGGFKFKNITTGSGVDNAGWAQAVSHSDINSDGWQDIILGNDFGVNAYYKNNADGTFTDISKQLKTDKASYSMSIGIADLNRDLVPDFYISNIVVMNKDEKYVSPNEQTTMKFNADKLATLRVLEANDLFLSQQSKTSGSDYQLSEAVGRGYSSTGWSWDADFFDFDNDGDSDLYVLNGMNEFNLYTSDNPYFTDAENVKKQVYIPVANKESNVFFINENGHFNNASQGSGIDKLGNSRSAAYLDFDRDGDLDIAMNNFHEQANFFRNNLLTKNSRWIALKLVGDPNKGVNRDAIGAKIVIQGHDGKTIWRELHGSIGYMSVHPKKQLIGLGNMQVESIKIIWPNGEQQLLPALAVNREYRVPQSKVAETILVGQ